MHSSNEMYGADRMLLEILKALPPADRAAAVVLIPDDLPRGDELLTKELAQLGIQSVISPLPVLRRRYLTASGLFPLIRRTWRAFRTITEARPDVVYCTTSAMVLCLPLGRFAGARSVVLHVQEIWSPKEALVLGLIARFATHVLSISDASLQSLSKGLRSRAQLIVNAHHDSGETLAPITSRSTTRFVVASRWNSWKGHRTLLSAWDTQKCPGELVILGGPPPIGTGVDVPALVRELRHPHSVKIVGEVKDIAPYIDDADFLLLPSDSPEPFGLVLLEAFARGRAVIASRAGGVLDIVEEGYNGLLFEAGNVDELRSVLASASQGRAEVLGQNARRRYSEKYSIDAYRARFRKLWTSISGYTIKENDGNS